MSKLEEIDRRLNCLLAQHDLRCNEPVYKIQLAVLMAERKSLLKAQTENSDK